MRLRERYRRYMIRPIVYQAFTRLAITLTLILLAREFSAPGDGRPVLPWGCMAAAAAYLLLAWVAWLRLDGARLPSLDHHLFRRKKRKDPFAGGGMADYLDEEPVSFEELDAEERDACLLAANLIVAALFGVAGAML